MKGWEARGEGVNKDGTDLARPWQRVTAWGVHLFTAAGAVVGVWCLVAIREGRYRAAFAGMMLAVFIDAVDGPLARLARVKDVLPMFDGSKLDDLVDYLNYVVVPVVLMHDAHLLPPGGSLWILSLPVLASAYRFCHASAKTPDHLLHRVSLVLEHRGLLPVCRKDASLVQRHLHHICRHHGAGSDQIHLSGPDSNLAGPHYRFGHHVVGGASHYPLAASRPFAIVGGVVCAVPHLLHCPLICVCIGISCPRAGAAPPLPESSPSSLTFAAISSRCGVS